VLPVDEYDAEGSYDRFESAKNEVRMISYVTVTHVGCTSSLRRLTIVRVSCVESKRISFGARIERSFYVVSIRPDLCSFEDSR
jgi:hypothetical protein